jgi:hypothetical protein
MKKIALCCLILLPLQSCFLSREAINQPLDHEVVGGIKIGTMASEVVTRMGAPDEVVQLGRRTAYRYQFNLTKSATSWWGVLILSNADSRRDTAWFFFDENQRLTHVGSTFESHHTGFHAFPWSDIYDADDAAAADMRRGLK